MAHSWGLCARFSRVGLGTFPLMPANKTMYASIWIPMYDSSFTEEFAYGQAAAIVASDAVPSTATASSVEGRRVATWGFSRGDPWMVDLAWDEEARLHRERQETQ